MDRALLARLDAHRGTEARGQWIERAIERQLDAEQAVDAPPASGPQG